MLIFKLQSKLSICTCADIKCHRMLLKNYDINVIAKLDCNEYVYDNPFMLIQNDINVNG